MFDRLVFVEGESDEAVIRQWAATLHKDLSQANVGFVVMGGVRNFAHYAAESILAILTKRQVKVWMVVDRDEQEDDEVRRLQEGLDNNGRLVVLTRRELENFMLDPSILNRMILLKRDLQGARGDVFSDDDVVRALDACADELKTLAIAKRVHRVLCSTVYPPRAVDYGGTDVATGVRDELKTMIGELDIAMARVDQVVAEKTQQVEQLWEAGKKLEVVPGDLLLDHVFQRFGVRFKKERDSERLAALTPEHLIPRELADLIVEVASV
jgi:hypothetical protein